MAAIRWTVGARADLREIVRFIAQDSEAYAFATAMHIVETAERLEQLPHLGRTVPEYGDPSVRELIYGNYRIVYRVRRQGLGILAVVHRKQDLMTRLRRRLPRGGA